MYSRGILGLLRCGAVAAGVAFSAAETLANPADCTAIDQPETRLACYDRLHGRAERDADPANAPAAPDRPPLPHSPSASMPTAAQKAEAPGPTGEHVAMVIAVGESATGRRWFRLDSGETWQQISPRRSDIRAGDTVRVAATATGSYHLRRADGSSRSSPVRRME